MMQVSQEIIYDARIDKWELEFVEDGENDTLVFDTLGLAMEEQGKLLQQGVDYIPRSDEASGWKTARDAIFTPLDATRRVRLWFKRTDVAVLSGDLDVRGIGKKARVRIGRTVYDVYGCACGLPGCACDAYIQPLTDPGATEAA